jgi:hypothetical protein
VKEKTTMPLEKPIAAEQGWKDVPAPEMIKWDRPGETIAGVFVSATTVQIDGKGVLQYTFQLGDKTLKCLATYDLRQKISPAHRGCQMRIKYLGEDENIRGGPNNTAMKVFSVQYKGSAAPPQPNAHGVTITDEDIPF